jgi:hypothetical protein
MHSAAAANRASETRIVGVALRNIIPRSTRPTRRLGEVDLMNGSSY